jgi:hypothetical protein
LRTISILRNQHKIPLQELRKVGDWLKEHFTDPWSMLRFFVIGKRVYFEDPETRLRLRPGALAQALLPINLAHIADETHRRALQFRERQPDQIGQITRHRYLESNAWVLAGTRVPTKAVWSFHTAGHDLATILAAYPSLSPAEVASAISFEEQQQRRKRAS